MLDDLLKDDTAKYVRISRDEDGSKESIGSQKDVIKDFAKEQGIELADIIEDNT